MTILCTIRANGDGTELSDNRRFEIALANTARAKWLERAHAVKDRIGSNAPRGWGHFAPWTDNRDSDGPNPLFFRGGVRQAITTVRFYREPSCFGPGHPDTLRMEALLRKWWTDYRRHVRLAHEGEAS